MGEWSKFTLLRGNLEMSDGKYVLIVPLAAGGNEFVKCTSGIGKIDAENLVITIPDWMVAKMALHNGSLVDIDNRDGKFTINEALEPD